MSRKLILLIKSSTFLRLLVIFLFTGFLLFTLVGGTAHYLSDPNRLLHKKFKNNIHHYTELLITEIGQPPNYDVAQNISENLGLQIKISGNNTSWQSDEYKLPALSVDDKKELKNLKDMKLGHKYQYSFIIINANDNEYIFVINHAPFTESKIYFLLFLILIVIIVIAISYFLVRWLFRPLRLIAEGVKQVGAGNFDFRVNTKHKDEMGQLAMAFNRMSEKIQSMMMEKEQLLMDVSHELRSPMTRMKLALEFINESKSTISIQEDLHYMDSMITELLESARLKNPNSALLKEKIQLHNFLSSIISNYNNSIPGVKLKKLLLGHMERIHIKKSLTTKALFLKSILSRFYVNSILFKCLRSKS